MDYTERLLVEIKALRKDIAEMDKKLTVHAALDGQDKKTLSEHDRILKGVNGTPSLPEQVRTNTKSRELKDRIIFYILTPLMLATGGGVVYIIVQGAKAAG